ARAVFGLPVDWPVFYVVNFVVAVLGVVAANLAEAAPGIALGFAALMLINGLLFHIAPFVVTRFRFSPGLITAVLLLLPVGAACYPAASDAAVVTSCRSVRAPAAGVLPAALIAGSLLLGAALMATPIVVLKLKDRPYFRQT